MDLLYFEQNYKNKRNRQIKKYYISWRSSSIFRVVSTSSMYICAMVLIFFAEFNKLFGLMNMPRRFALNVNK